MPGSSMIGCTVPLGANCASSTVIIPSGKSSTSRFSTGMRDVAINVTTITDAAIRLAELKKSSPRPTECVNWE